MVEKTKKTKKKAEKEPKAEKKLKVLRKKEEKKKEAPSEKEIEKEVKKEITKKETNVLREEKKKAPIYYLAVGRRKSSVARAYLLKNGSGKVEVNGKELSQYFPWSLYQEEINAPLLAAGQKDKLDVKCVVNGGGMHSQAQAIRLALARALLRLNPVFRRALKKRGFLTRDARVKERKKYGLKRARRAPQWGKR